MTNIRLRKRACRGSNCGRHFMTRVSSRQILRASIFIVACCCFSNASPRASSTNEESAEYPVKLALVYNFTRFVEWPANSYRGPDAPLVICIVGNDPFSPAIEGDLRSRTVGSHPIEVRTLGPRDIMSVCHVVFVPVTAEDQATRIVRVLRGSSTLTVGESAGFAVRGGIINLTTEGNKVHFEVNLLAAERAGLKISSNMLALAKIVHDEMPSAED